MIRAFSDLADLPEDERIDIIAAAALDNIVGFIVDDETKADRYIEMLKKYPNITIFDKKPGPIKGTILVRVGPTSTVN